MLFVFFVIQALWETLLKKSSHCVSFLYLWMAAKNALSTREWFCEIECPPPSDTEDKGHFIRKPGSLEGFNLKYAIKFFRFISKWIEWFIQSILYQQCILCLIGEHVIYTADDNTCCTCRHKLRPMTIYVEAHDLSPQFIFSLVTRLVFF